VKFSIPKARFRSKSISREKSGCTTQTKERSIESLQNIQHKLQESLVEIGDDSDSRNKPSDTVKRSTELDQLRKANRKRKKRFS
jgi:hypothetical protein